MGYPTRSDRVGSRTSSWLEYRYRWLLARLAGWTPRSSQTPPGVRLAFWRVHPEDYQ